MRGAGGLVFLIIIVLVVISLGGTGFMAPVRLGLAQEFVLGVVHGGIVDVREDIYVDNCVRIEGDERVLAVQRTRRTVFFGDGTTLETIFSGQPVESNAQC